MSDEKTAKRRVTLRDVAQAAGVSLKTASNVINGSGRMTDETRAKVESVIKDLDYRVNVAARNLNRDHTGFITLAVPSLIPPYLAELANRTIEAAADGQAPFDITVQNQNADHLGCVDFDALLTAHGMESDALAWRQDTPIYYNDPAVTGIEDASAAIRLSDCNGLLARQGAPAYPGPLPGLLAEGSAPLATGNLGLTCVVIPDEMAEKLSLRRQVWSADYAGDPEETEKQVQAALAEYQETTAYLRVESRLSLYQEIMGNKLLALFLGLYLGLTFLLAAAAVLALQQLSQAADNAARYAVLRRLGAEEGMLSRSAVQQVALAFLLPLALALLHTVVGMKAANDLISTAAKVDTVHSALVTGGVLLAVYGGYFLATALAFRHQLFLPPPGSGRRRRTWRTRVSGDRADVQRRKQAGPGWGQPV